jgi:hypothetical protein
MRIPNDFILAIIDIVHEEDFCGDVAAARLVMLHMKNSYISDFNALQNIYFSIDLLKKYPHFTEPQFLAHSKISFTTMNRHLGGYQNIRMLLNIDELQINLELSSDTPNNVIDLNTARNNRKLRP